MLAHFRLALAITLSLLPTLATAQNPIASPAAPSKDTILFDFDNGTFDGWTLTGDCWPKQPATAKTYADKQGNPLVSGIVGSGYLITVNKGAADTGKAVSKDFVIDKPFLTFKIGGGHYPKEACLNLVVDGKIVRTETGDYVPGDESYKPSLKPAYWDVYALMGKTAHLEIVDATSNSNRGYVMLDDLCLAEIPNTPEQKILTQMAENWRQKYRLPGVWAVVVKDERTVACVASGVRNIKTGSPASINDYCKIGSATKPITGMMIAMMVDRGIISWKTRVRDLFPTFVQKYPQSPFLDASVASLLAHTAGFPPHSQFGLLHRWQDWKHGGGPAARFRTLESILQGSEMASPNTRYEYSNDGPPVAVALVERALGDRYPYEQWVTGKEGKALGLTHPETVDRSRKIRDDEIYPHLVEDSGEISVNDDIDTTAPNESFYQPSGSMSLTLADISRLIQAVLNNSPNFSKASWQAITTRFIPDIHSDTLASWHLASGGYLFHEGGLPRGDEACIMINPAKSSGFGIYVNQRWRSEKLHDATGTIGKLQADLHALLGTFSRK